MAIPEKIAKKISVEVDFLKKLKSINPCLFLQIYD
jgi:hypothetical protein